MARFSPRHLWQLFLLTAVLVLAVAWSIAAWHVDQVDDEVRTDALRHIQALAHVHAEQAALTLSIADDALLHLRATLENEGFEAFRREAARFSGPTAGGPIDRVALVGTDGQTRTSYFDGKEAAEQTNVADREYFKALAGSREDRTFVTEPFTARLSKQWVILFARPILRDGAFAGLIFVGFETRRLGLFFDAIDPDNEMVALISPAGRIIASSAGEDEQVGETMALPPETGRTSLSRLRQRDGAERIISVQEIPGWGMRVIAGVDKRKLDSEIRSHAQVAFLPAILLTLLLIPAAWLIYRTHRSQQVAHDALQQETRRSRTVFETMNEGLLLLDNRGAIVFSNATAASWFPDAQGMLFAEAVLKAGFTVVTEDGNAYVSDDPVTVLCLEMGSHFDDAWLRYGDDDGATWLSLSARAIHDDGGAVSGVTLTLTDRSKEHEQLTESALAASILEDMQDAVMITDAKGILLRTNPAFTLMTGYGRDEVRGQTPAILNSGRHDEAFFAAMWTTLREQGHWSGKVWNRRKSGEEFCVWHNITSIRNVHGKIMRFITVSRDITEQETRESHLWQRANFDPLTGLANRTRFEDRLALMLAKSLRHDEGFAVCYLDLDRFKPVNDTLGHAAGDELLRQAAQRMRSVLREEDTLARIGGDEFALLLPRTKNPGDASRVSGKILSVIHAPFDLPEGTASIGISIGIAAFPDDGQDAETLCTAADLALYAAKAAGRNCWRFAEHPDDTEYSQDTEAKN